MIICAPQGASHCASASASGRLCRLSAATAAGALPCPALWPTFGAASPMSSSAASSGQLERVCQINHAVLRPQPQANGLVDWVAFGEPRQACNRRPTGPGSSPARRRYQASRSAAPVLGAPGVARERRSGDRGRRSDGVPRAQRRRQSPLLRAFSARPAGVPIPETAGPSGVGPGGSRAGHVSARGAFGQ
jgi:hypothetical protein